MLNSNAGEVSEPLVKSNLIIIYMRGNINAVIIRGEGKRLTAQACRNNVAILVSGIDNL